MIAYIIRRLFSGLIMLTAVSFVTVILFNLGPDSAREACGKNCSPQVIEDVRRAMGLDKSPVVQWAEFAKGVVAGREFPSDPEIRKRNPQLALNCEAPCFGMSRVNTGSESKGDVRKFLMDKIPISFSLALVAFAIWMIVGCGVGIITALYRGTFLDKFLVSIFLAAYAFPSFFIGILIYKFFFIQWNIGTEPKYVPLTEDPLGWLSGLLLPAVTLALIFIAGYVRMTRSYVLESMSEDYLRTAKAKGLAPRPILWKHTMRAALTPIVTIAGLDLGGLMGGAVITEQVFELNGLGRTAVGAINSSDLPTVMGIVLIVASCIILANIIVDVLYAVIDPRVKYA